MAWSCRFLAAQPSQDGRGIAEKRLSEEFSGASDTLVDFHTVNVDLRASLKQSVDDLREAVTTLEDAGRIARRVLGGTHPTTEHMAVALRQARAALRARETPSAR